MNECGTIDIDHNDAWTNEGDFMNLQNKTVLFLGSSVTYGAASGGVSFVELMADACGIHCIKEAVSGTTLADINDDSYVARLKKVDTSQTVDLFICQLSTNDASPKKNPNLSDTEDAIRFVLQYVKDTFSCPIVFYTGTYFENERYVEMINFLYRLQDEYEFHILDLYNDQEMRNISEEQYQVYMRDVVHPTLEGYKEWWTPKFIAFCEQLEE